MIYTLQPQPRAAGSDHAGAGGAGTSTSVGPDPAATTLPGSEPSPATPPDQSTEWLAERTLPAKSGAEGTGTPLPGQEPGPLAQSLKSEKHKQQREGQAVESKRGAY